MTEETKHTLVISGWSIYYGMLASIIYWSSTCNANPEAGRQAFVWAAVAYFSFLIMRGPVKN